MAGKKKPYDGVVTAVHYAPNGDIDWVRAFERHGFVFSDRLVLDRKTLVDRLRAGKRFKTGKRIPRMGADFEVFEDIRLIGQDNKPVIAVGEGRSARDELGGLPLL